MFMAYYLKNANKDNNASPLSSTQLGLWNPITAGLYSIMIFPLGLAFSLLSSRQNMGLEKEFRGRNVNLILLINVFLCLSPIKLLLKFCIGIFLAIMGARHFDILLNVLIYKAEVSILDFLFFKN